MKIVDKLKNLIAPEIDADFEDDLVEKEIDQIAREEQKVATGVSDKEYQYEDTFKYPVVFDDDDLFDDFEPINDHVTETVKAIPAEEKRIEHTFTRLPRPEKAEMLTKKPFKPSPIISPVYGIISGDKKITYHQVNTDTINIKEEPKSNLSFDIVRKKAYGTIEDDIERVIDEGNDIFYNLEEPDEIEDNIIEEFVENVQDLGELTIGEAIDSYEYRGVATDTTNQTRTTRNKDKTVEVAEEETSDLDEDIDEVMNLIDEMYQEEEK